MGVSSVWHGYSSPPVRYRAPVLSQAQSLFFFAGAADLHQGVTWRGGGDSSRVRGSGLEALLA